MNRTVGFESLRPVALTQISATGFRLLATMTYRSASGRMFVIPGDDTAGDGRGLETDLASVPWTLRALFSPYGAYTAAVIFHDFLWRVAIPAGMVTYREADALLREAMGTLRRPRVWWHRRWSMWAAVRWGALLTRRGGHIGWWRDASRVVAVTILLAPIMAWTIVGNLPGLILFKGGDLLAAALSTDEAPDDTQSGEQLGARR